MFQLVRSVSTAVSLLFILSQSTIAAAETRFTIIHTSDLHSHFTNHESARKLGGFPRVKTVVDRLRDMNANSILLDAGDWSEGNIFFALDSGVATQRFLQYMGYDAMVLGNHDWLVGADELYEAFSTSGMTVPVLSANLNMSALPASKDLSKFIRPYIIKEVDGKKIGIFGLSTFQVVFDHFFDPVGIQYPVKRAKETVRILREIEKVDAVILLSHLGLEMDKGIAATVKGIDIIVGGHNHLLLKKPAKVKGVPILHIGQWGEYVGEYQVVINDKGEVRLESNRIHQIDRTVEEDSIAKTLVDGFTADVENLFDANVFGDKIVRTDVDLPRPDQSNNILADWAVDAFREATGTDLALDLPFYYAQQFRKGDLNTADFFNLNPHIWSSRTGTAWTLYTYEVKGFTLEVLFQFLSKAGFPIKVSNAQFTVDKKRKLPARDFHIGGKPINIFKTYTITSTRGVLDVFRELKKRHIDLKVRNIEDTGIEAWRQIAKKLASMSPITPEKLTWAPRVRMVQPDLFLPGERVQVEELEDRVNIRFQYVNQGLTPTPRPTVDAIIDHTPDNTLDEEWDSLEVSIEQGAGEMLGPDRFVNGLAVWRKPKSERKGIYTALLRLQVLQNEAIKRNNSYELYIDTEK